MTEREISGLPEPTVGADYLLAAGGDPMALERSVMRMVSDAIALELEAEIIARLQAGETWAEIFGEDPIDDTEDPEA